MIGRVVSAKMNKTVAVLVEGSKTHPLYGKTFVWSKKYLVHDELGAKDGDMVTIVATKPISKRKHFKVVKIIGKDVVALGEAAMKQEAAEAIAEVMPEEKATEATEATKETKVEAEAVIEAKEKASKVKEPKAKKEKAKKKEAK